MTCWQIVVLPDDSGPKISVIRPRGMPPTPSARSSAIEPVGMKSTACRSTAPSFMIEPRPELLLDREDRGVDGLAPLRLGRRSAVRRDRCRSARPPSALRSSPWFVTLLSIRFRHRQATLPGRDLGRSALVGLSSSRPASACAASGSAPPAAAAAPRATCSFGWPRLVLRLLLRFAVGTISRAHRCSSASERRLPIGPSRGLLRGFTAARSGPRASAVPACSRGRFRTASRCGSWP